jgi:hypothetical protein
MRAWRSPSEERECAAEYIHTWAMALKGRGWSGEQVADKMFDLARDIRNGAAVTDSVVAERLGKMR